MTNNQPEITTKYETKIIEDKPVAKTDSMNNSRDKD